MNARTCCCCFQLHQGFVNILYIDIARILWGVVMTIIIFTRSDSTRADKASNLITLISIAIQGFLAIFIIAKGTQQIDLRLYDRYRKTKLCYIVANVLEKILIPILDCQIFYKYEHFNDSMIDTYCAPSEQAVTLCIGFFWNCVEYYFYRIVYLFCIRTFLGFYGKNYPQNQQGPPQQRQRHLPVSKKVTVFEVTGICYLPFHHRLTIAEQQRFYAIQNEIMNGVVIDDNALKEIKKLKKSKSIRHQNYTCIKYCSQ